MYIWEEPGDSERNIVSGDGSRGGGGASPLGRLNTTVHRPAGGFSRRDTIS